jgi:high-affinity Fe2+/Pb2+ permease
MQGVVYDWVLGVVISFVVALVATVLFYLGSLDRGTRSRERVRVAER